jgi:hypothetical protein
MYCSRTFASRSRPYLENKLLIGGRRVPSASPGKVPESKRKSRLVIFRVPDEDYAALTKWCAASGARSVSEFVRLAVLERVEMLGARRVTFSGDLNTLGKTLGELDELLREASKSISRLLGPAQGDKPE